MTTNIEFLNFFFKSKMRSFSICFTELSFYTCGIFLEWTYIIPHYSKYVTLLLGSNLFSFLPVRKKGNSWKIESVDTW